MFMIMSVFSKLLVFSGGLSPFAKYCKQNESGKPTSLNQIVTWPKSLFLISVAEGLPIFI